ncbi:probable multidrug resistance-associated protein lethal(2)03659 isoform X2 [Rhopalosiphum padi]|uniref:probable multidrug resistance-associated protein lethal(2)03659 isoform X2 n=1 Tax=Rhopalosiphum padi TaxID=40932 RepID=UPI00298DE151|nr:probable multidrug resistance-associated protein lethal(2)03659 isoform X2 [Rhopalosiphum padi]
MEAANKKKKQLPNPRANANIFEILTFSWILNLFKTGQKRDLETNDLYAPLDDDKSSLLGFKFEKIWKNEITNAKRTNREPSLSRVIIRMFGGHILFYGLIQMFTETILGMIQPILIGKLLEYFNHGESNIINLEHAYMYALGLLINMLAIILLNHYSQVELWHLGMKIRVACCSVIYKKALTLSGTSICASKVGQVVNLITNDVNRIDKAFKHIHYLWIGPLQIILVTYCLWQEIGVASIIGVTVFFVLGPLHSCLGKKNSGHRSKTASRTDKRVKLMNEIISGIQGIKMHAWEKPFESLVQYSRKMEIGHIKGGSLVRVFLQSFKIFHFRFAIFQLFPLFTSISSYTLLRNIINTQNVFIIISYFSILRKVMSVSFPHSVLTLSDILITDKRIQTFLLQDEKKKQNKPLLLKSETRKKNGIEMSNINRNNYTKNSTSNQKDKNQSNNLGIDVLNVSAKWILNQPKNSLNNINLSIRPGRLVAIIGPVGAGKTSLIQAILRELPLCEGSISVCGTVSYASQEPWLFNGSIQQNILFGSPMDYCRYEEVIEVCALKTDFKQLPYGDRSLVGERGVSLSGGQRARVNLARAVYKQADIYLLDDPLSAVDTHVGKHLFEKCIKDYLKEKTCILITHQIQYLSSVDQIVLMESANILAENSYQEDQSSDLDFKKLSKSLEETTDYEIDDTNASINNSVEQLTSLSCQGSIASISSSIDDNELNETQDAPIEVAETRSSGKVSRSIYSLYISSGGNAFSLLFLLFISLFTQMLGTGGDYWLIYWVNLEDNVHRNNTETNSTNISNFIFYALSDTPLVISNPFYVITYSIINIAMLVFIGIRCAMFVTVLIRASTNLHNNMFNAITGATMHFFNTNSSGRILNRFTNDIGAIDEVLPTPLLDFVHMALQLPGTLVVVGIMNYYLLIPIFIIGLMCYYTVHFYLSTSRSIKRLESVSRSPVYDYLNASLKGISTIRAFEAEDILSKEFDDHQDLHSSTSYLFITSSEAFGFSLDIICFIYICILTFSFLIVNNDNFGGYVGLVLSQAINMMGPLQLGLRQLAELDNQMTSVERVVEYTNIPQEAFESSADKKPPKEWPDKGQIVFENFYLRYSLDTAHVLKDLNIQIQAMEKVELKTIVEDLPDGLNSKISEGGSNFSAGQRQLVCLARAIVRSNKILVLDEATANVDSQTDALIQNTIRKQFRSCTVLTIAHRLNTVMGSDRVLVMDAGTIVEFDHPLNLLKNKDGFFYKMVEQTGTKTSHLLHTIAAKSYTNMKS